jgi:predicted ATP-binding protein involved in virulence
MYIKEIKIENYGPITNLDITPKFDDNGKPKPIVLIGKNGSGKTLLLGNILDGLIELKRQKFSEFKEVGENKYLKVGKKDYIKNRDEYSYIKIKFGDDQHSATFIDLMTGINHADFLSKYGNRNFEGQNDG